MKVIPAILENEATELYRKIEILKKNFYRIHIDIIDESYGQNNLRLLEERGGCGVGFLEVHLMTEKPVEIVEKMGQLGARLVFGQWEKVVDKIGFSKEYGKREIETGLAIDLETEIENEQISKINIKHYILMAVKAGKAGQKFDKRVLSKIKRLRNILGNNAEILVDGGINFDTAIKCGEAGADGVLVNSFLWQNYAKNLIKLKELEA